MEIQLSQYAYSNSFGWFYLISMTIKFLIIEEQDEQSVVGVLSVVWGCLLAFWLGFLSCIDKCKWAHVISA
jgi:hypothetical protein